MTRNITTLNFVHKRRLIQAERRKRAAITSTHQAAVYGHARQHRGQNKETGTRVCIPEYYGQCADVLINTSVQRYKHL